jgi:hypothetical protein
MTFTTEFRIKRSGYIIELVGLGQSVDFNPKRFKQTLDAIIEKMLQISPGLKKDKKEFDYQKVTVEQDLTEIYKAYDLEQKQQKLRLESSNAEQSELKKVGDQLVELALNNIKGLFKDQYNCHFAHAHIVDHYEIIAIESDKFKRYLTKLYYDRNDKQVVKPDVVKNAVQLLAAKAEFEGATIPLELRVAWNRDGTIVYYYDLTNDKWEVVRITITAAGLEESTMTSGGAWVVEKPSFCVFKRHKNHQPQVFPERSYPADIFDRFINLMNVKDADSKLLLKCYIISLFIPEIPKAILMLHGEQGSAKSTLQELIKMLVDPSTARTLAFPRDINELIQKLSHNYISYFDNISHIPDWISDQLCRGVTGSGFSKRQLWTDDDDVIYNFKRCIGFNGINLAATKADLLDRGLIIQLDYLPKGKRKKLKDIWYEFEQLRPQLLGYIFDILAKVLNMIKTTPAGRDLVDGITELPRMADFAEIAEVISRCMGYKENEFLNAYKRNIGLQTEQIVEGNYVANAVVYFMADKDEWTGTATELLDELEHVAETLKIKTKNDKAWPAAPNQLTRRLNEVQTNLRQAGIEIEKDRDAQTKARLVKLCKTPPPSLPSLPDPNQTRFDTEIGGGGGGSNDDLHTSRQEEQCQRR